MSGAGATPSLAGRTILVTGASGFLGSALMDELHAHGASLHAIARPTTRREHLAHLPLRWHEADLEDPPALSEAFARAGLEARSEGRRFDAVHAAALIRYRPEDSERSRRVNVQGTRHVLEAAVAHGVRRLCHVSSVVACGFAPDGRTELTEEVAFNGARLRSGYVTTKRHAEVLALALSVPPEVVSCLPGAVFGPSPSGSNTTRFLQHIERGTLGPFAPPGSLSVVGVADVARGIRLALERGRHGRRYLLCESNLTLRELQTRAARALGVRPPRASVPPWLWRGVVGAASLVSRVRPLEEATPEALRLLGTHFRFSAARAREELGWRPRPFDEVLAETVAWMGSSRTGDGGGGGEL